MAVFRKLSDGRVIRQQDAAINPVTGEREHPNTVYPARTNRIDMSYWMDAFGQDTYNTRGLGGGGQMPIRNMKQATRPRKVRHRATRFAHPSLLRVHY